MPGHLPWHLPAGDLRPRCATGVRLAWSPLRAPADSALRTQSALSHSLTLPPSLLSLDFGELEKNWFPNKPALRFSKPFNPLPTPKKFRDSAGTFQSDLPEIL